MPLTINKLVDICFEQAKESGFGEKEIPFPEMIALIHSEASEALEEYRHNRPISWTDENSNPPNKPEGIASEFADIVIRVGHYCAILQIDLESEIERKLAYNKTRSYRHGGKKI